MFQVRTSNAMEAQAGIKLLCMLASRTSTNLGANDRRAGMTMRVAGTVGSHEETFATHPEALGSELAVAGCWHCRAPRTHLKRRERAPGARVRFESRRSPNVW